MNKEMNVKSRVKKWLFLGWSIVLLSILVIFYVYKIDFGRPDEKIGRLEVWTQKMDGGEKKEILLPYNLYEENNENAEIYTRLPEEFKSSKTICFWTYFQDVEVYLNDEKIYFAGETKFGKATISQWNYVDVPSDSDGKTLTIYMSTPYDSYKFSMTDVVFGSAKEIQGWLAGTYGFNQKMDFILMIVGIGFVVGAFLQNIDHRYKMCHLSFGLTALFFGIWLRTGTKGYPIYGIDTYASCLTAYLTFFLIPIPLTMYVKMRVKKRDKLVKVCEAMLAVECLIIIGVFMMQAFGIRDIQENLFVGQISLIISVVWAVCVAMFYYIRMRMNISILTVMNAFLLVIAVAAEYVSSNTLLVQVRSDIIIRLCIITILVFEFLLFLRHLREKDVLRKKIQEENRNLQLQVLTSQIRPHFILNTLGAIRSLIRHDPDRASDLLYDFSKYIRRNMEQKDYSRPVPFLEELDYIETYLNLEKIRFSEKLEIEYDIQEDGFWVLPLTVQPFVENAVKHGLQKMRQGGTVWISTYKKGKNIVVEIRDSGIGFDTAKFWSELEERKSVGMRSAIFRLESEMKAACEIESSMIVGESGTCVRIYIPEKGAYRDENNNCR